MIADQHPANGRQSDEDGDRDRPGADADIAGGLPFGFVLRDLAISYLVVVLRLVHRLSSRPEGRPLAQS